MCTGKWGGRQTWAAASGVWAIGWEQGLVLTRQSSFLVLVHKVQNRSYCLLVLSKALRLVSLALLAFTAPWVDFVPLGLHQSH